MLLNNWLIINGSIRGKWSIMNQLCLTNIHLLIDYSVRHVNWIATNKVLCNWIFKILVVLFLYKQIIAIKSWNHETMSRHKLNRNKTHTNISVYQQIVCYMFLMISNNENLRYLTMQSTEPTHKFMALWKFLFS